MKLARVLLLAILIATLIAPTLDFTQSAKAENDADLMMPRYFDETGFWVQGHFREYWETRGDLYIFGYPISGVFMQDGYYRQYFERAVFEYHPQHAGSEYEVQLMLLGSIRTEDRKDEPGFQTVAPFENSRDHRYFPHTQHSVNYGFKHFWESNDGQRNFGWSISEEFQEQPPVGDGKTRTVQYFERNRFEWHPEHKGSKYEILLGLLGSEFLIQRGAPASATQKQDPHMPPYDPTRDIQYGPHAGYGFNVFFRGDADGYDYHDKMFDMVENAGFGWIKIQVQWSEVHRMDGGTVFFDFRPVERLVEHAEARGVKVVASVAKTPGWVEADGGIPEDTTQFENLMREMSGFFSGRIHAYEIWNEQNLAHEVGGYVDPAEYVDLLKAGYNGVQAGDSDATVLFGGLTPTGVNNPDVAINDVQYLEQIYAHNNGEVRNYFDHLGAHPGSNNNPPDTMYPENPGPGGWSGDPSFYFKRIEQLRDVMVANNDAEKQIWLTEFGWTTANQAPGYEYGAEISEQQQAENLVRAYQIAKEEWPWMGVMLVWNLNYSTIVDPADEKYPWAVVNSDWSPRPAYEALKNMDK